MRKLLAIYVFCALLMTGCSKERSREFVATGGIEICVADMQRTKASFNSDGAAACVNRCKMQVLLGDCLIYEETVGTEMSQDRVTAHFEGVTLADGESYDFLFWADCASNVGGKFSDLFYDTGDLRNVRINPADYRGNLDSRDAFSKCVTLIGGEELDGEIVLTRPFAQLNVIALDVDELRTQMEDEVFSNMFPCKFSLSFRSPSVFDVRTQEASEDALFSVEGLDAYGGVALTEGKQCLTMDYILADADEKKLVDIEWSAKGVVTEALTCLFSNVPLQRNCRTNVIGNLFSVEGNWSVEIEPDWSNYEYYVD